MKVTKSTLAYVHVRSYTSMIHTISIPIQINTSNKS